jgi:hypothetical protein
MDSTLYTNLVGSLLYLIVTRPDIMYATSFVSRFMESTKYSQWNMVKRNLRYVVGTLNFGLWYTQSDDNHLSSYKDSDFVGSRDDRKNTSENSFHLGMNLISWDSKKQPIVLIYSCLEPLPLLMPPFSANLSRSMLASSNFYKGNSWLDV